MTFRIKTRSRSKRSFPLRSLLVLAGVFSVGCSTVPQSFNGLLNSSMVKPSTDAMTIAERAADATQSAIVSNPRAKEIRFDGQELVLGSGDCQALPGSELHKTVGELLGQDKKRSATAMISLHIRSAQRMLIDGIGKPSDRVNRFVASVLDKSKSQNVWNQHLTACSSKPEESKRFLSERGKIFRDQTGVAASESVALLEKIATDLESLPLQLESKRVTALASVAAGDSVSAVRTLASAAELAAQSSLPSLSSDLWMLACQSSLHSDNVEQGRQCWKAAVANQLTAIRSRPVDQQLPTVDTVFWEQSYKLKHPSDQFPTELNLVFAPWSSRIGIALDNETHVVLWSAIAEFQLSTGQPHLAALALKRAEVGASQTSKPWLQIALARSMAAQGQESLAVTILGSLGETQTPAVQAASLATLGSIKVQAGAYEQGSRFLIEALSTTGAGNWPGQLAAKADLAIVRLIVGRLDEALPALHAVQNEMMTAGLWQSLCQSLENEAAIVELEEGKADAREIRDRIRSIENQS